MDNLTLNEIDYKWADKTEDLKFLKKGLKLLKDDGGIRILHDTKNEKISAEEIGKHSNDIFKWEKDIQQSDNILSEKKEDLKITDIENKKLAENEKNKGNECMQSKEYDEALRFYNNSIRINPVEPTTYCNRALSYIKLKQYEKGLLDCNKAIELKTDYSKAYYRRATCLISICKFRDALNDLIYILGITPKSPEILEEIKLLKEKWKIHLGKDDWIKNGIENEIEERVDNANKGVLSSTCVPVTSEKSSFKKIKIVEEIIKDSVKKEIPDDVDQELKTKFINFMHSGEAVKCELNKLIEKKIFKKADELARQALKNCQNFIQLFKIGTKYHSQIEKAIEEINILLETIKIKLTEENSKSSNDEVDSNKSKYYKTKILSEEKIENATKLAETDMNFEDFPRTSYGFDKAYNSMKKRDELFFNFLKHIGAQNFERFYQNIEISYQVLTGILQNLNKQLETSSDNNIITIQYLIAMSKTKNFSLVKKFLKKTDKELLRKMIESLKTINPLQSMEIEKLYY